MTAGDLAGTTVILTGGTSGIGRRAVERLAHRGATVAAIGRDPAAGRQLEQDAAADSAGRVTFHQTDLARQSNVRALADELRETYDGIDVLVHNAGLSRRRRTETADGIELTLAVNHLAPYLLTHELLDRVRASAPARIVVTASDIHRRGSLSFEDLQFTDRYDAIDAYARSKLANVAFTVELAARLDDAVTANCFHPGFVPATGLFRDAAPWTRAGLRVLAMVPGVGTTVEAGARRLERLATAPEYGEQTGVYVTGSGIESPSPAATDPMVRRQLWEESAALVGVDPDWP